MAAEVASDWLTDHGGGLFTKPRTETFCDRHTSRPHIVTRVVFPLQVAFLLSEAAGFATGQNYVLDGGMTRKMIYV